MSVGLIIAMAHRETEKSSSERYREMEQIKMSDPTSKCGLIVIIENDQSIREVLQFAIESEGYLVRTACDGEEAFALLKELKVPCLILTDLMMPGMNGYEFIELASKTHTIASIPIVIVSASATNSEVKVMTEAGKIKGLVKKPVNLDFLLAIVHEHCGAAPGRPCP